MKWSYGVTTVPKRFNDLLPRTLASLKEAGFDSPRLFVDGAKELPEIFRSYEATFRFPKVRTFGNWILTLWELYLREPTADCYAIFQDDFVTYRNLRGYLEKCDFPKRGYWNLYTFPQNEKKFNGWYLSNQLGKGAVGLIFNNEGVRTLLGAKHMIGRPLSADRGWKAVDGGIVTAMKQAGWQEWVHNPSLVYHTGEVSSMGNKHQEQTQTFRGEDFNALELIKSPVITMSNPTAKADAVSTKKGHSRIGIVGYNCATGIGELNRQLAVYGDVSVWLVQPHQNYPTNPPHENVDTIFCPTGQTRHIEDFMKRVDMVVFVERPFYNEIMDIGKRLGKHLVCIPMMEWMPPGARGWPQDVDLFICPTKDCYDQFKHVVPSVYFPWPVDTERFKSQRRRRDTCERFLFVAGHGGWKGRKGIDVVLQAKKLWPSMPLTVISQEGTKWPSDVQVLQSIANNSDLYNVGDVLVCPHSVDGLGLEPMEAMACGLPVISTDGVPWNEIPSIGKIKATTTRRSVRRPVNWHLPNPESLVEICKRFVGQSITKKSEEAMEWADSMSWSLRAKEFIGIVRDSTMPAAVVLGEAI